MKISVYPQTFTILKMDPNSSIPLWVMEEKEFTSITYTREELSIVCSERVVPNHWDNGVVDKDWRAIKVEGPLDFSLTGILASLSTTLAEANVSVFAISTFDTDYILVKQEKLIEAITVLTRNGHELVNNAK